MKIKITKPKKVQYQIFDFSKGLETTKGENIMSLESTPLFYNYKVNSGVLTRGAGFKKFEFLNNPDSSLIQQAPDDDFPTETFYKAWHYKVYSNIYNERKDKLMLLSTTNKLYYCWLFSQYHLIVQIGQNAVGFTNVLDTLNYKYNGNDYSLICAGSQGFWYLQDGYMPQQVQNAPQISSVCAHKDLLFLVVTDEKYTIRITNQKDFTQWNTTLASGESEIEFDCNQGQILKLISFLGNVFAFRDYGITKITTYNSNIAPNISHIFGSGGKINKNTIAVAGDKVLFLSKDGLYSFDGADTTKIDIDVNEKIDTQYDDKAYACYHNGKYYLACRLKYNDSKTIGSEQNDGHINNSLVIYDINTKTTEIVRGVDIMNMTVVQERAMDKVVFCFRSDYNGFVGEIAENSICYSDAFECFWRSPYSDLGYSDKKKLIEEISLVCHYDTTFTINFDGQTKSYQIKGSDKMTKIKPYLLAKQFSLAFSTTNESAYVSNVKLTISLVDYAN